MMMRRVTLMLAMMAVALVVGGGVALAALFVGTSGRDDLRGTNRADEMYGLRGADEIRGRGGEDYIEGGTGPDDLFGNDNGDEIYGGKGDDRMFGGDGNDYLNSADDASDTQVDCGAGADRYTADLVDTVENCETLVPTFP